jgi:hypothetical protein
MTISIKILYIECHYAKCRDLFIVMHNVVLLSVVMLCVIMLNVVMLSVVMLSAIMLSVVMLSVIMLSVVVLNVGRQIQDLYYKTFYANTYCKLVHLSLSATSILV